MVGGRGALPVPDQHGDGPGGNISAVERAMGAETAGAPVAPAVRGGVVSRGVLFGRLTGARRVTVLSAQAGGGETVLLRALGGAGGRVGPAPGGAVPGGER